MGWGVGRGDLGRGGEGGGELDQLYVGGVGYSFVLSRVCLGWWRGGAVE